MNKTATYSPMPWRIEGPTKGCDFPLVIGADGSEVAVVYSGDMPREPDADEHQAMPHARLIRAAPELLAAVQALLVSIDAIREEWPFTWDDMVATSYGEILSVLASARQVVASVAGESAPAKSVNP